MTDDIASGTSSQVYIQIPLLVFQARGQRVELVETAAAEFDLKPSEAIAVLRLSAGPACVGELAEMAGMRQNGASVLVERLAVRGLVARHRKATDRRVVDVALTDAGRSLVVALIPDLEEQMRLHLSPLSDAEQTQMVLFLRRLIEGITSRPGGRVRNGRSAKWSAPLEFLLLVFEGWAHLSEMLESVFREAGLLSAESIALLRLSLGPTNVAAIATAVGIRRNGASILIDRLVARDLVKRARRTDDRRVVDVCLAEAGSDLISAALPELEDRVHADLSAFSAGERDRLVSMVRRRTEARSS